MTTNVQSAIAAVKPNGKVSRKVFKDTAKETTTLANPIKLTEDQALALCFQYGKTIAGQDGFLTKALEQFPSEAFAKKATQQICAAYYMDKLSYSKDDAFIAVGKFTHNKDDATKQSGDYRTLKEERIMVSVRMLVGRAKQLAGIVNPETVARQEKANKTKEENKRAADAVEAERQKAWEIVHPQVTEDFDVNAALNALVARIRSLMNEHSARITGDSGSAWREWLAKAPKVK